jgi:hypothetical protein
MSWECAGVFFLQLARCLRLSAAPVCSTLGFAWPGCHHLRVEVVLLRKQAAGTVWYVASPLPLVHFGS